MVEPENMRLKLWEKDYEEIAAILVHEHGFKGETALKAIKGGWLWEGFKKSFRLDFLRRLRSLGVTFEIVQAKKRESVFMLGADRVQLAKAIRRAGQRRVITPEQRRLYLLRLGRGEFPDRDDEFEIGLELDLILDG